MRKVKVEREMPFAKVGLIEESDKAGFFHIGDCTVIWNPQEIQRWVDGKWLSWVKEEKSLEDELKDGNIIMNVTAAKIATDYFKNKSDDEVEENDLPDSCNECGRIRTKNEGGETFTVCNECWDKHVTKVLVEEPQSLEEKFSKFRMSNRHDTLLDLCKGFVQIATDHFKEKFDKALNNCHCMKEMKSGDTLWDIRPIRKEMFE